jgi:6-phosphogluconolactonase
VRTLIAAAFLALILAAFCPPVAAQNAPPTFLFVLENGGSPIGAIRVFSVGFSTGAISEVSGSPFNAGLGPASLALDPTGRFLYVANNLSDDVTAFSVDPVSGALTELPGSPVSIGGETQAIGIDPTGRFLYVFAINGPGQSLFEFTIDGVSGALAAVPSAVQPGSPRPFRLIPKEIMRTSALGRPVWALRTRSLSAPLISPPER